MNKKLLLFVICLLTFSFANAQINTIAIVGDGTSAGWPPSPQPAGYVDPIQMTSTDKVHWTLSNLTLKNGPIKFRANNAWTFNWGDETFPNGTATLGGKDIKAVRGVYNVTFNSTTLVYNFEDVNPIISIIGDATPGGLSVDTNLTTVDGIIYTLKNVPLVAGALKFRADHSSTNNWGGTALSGTGVVDGNALNIPTAGLYDITFNKNSLQYSVTFQTISIIGSVLSADWSIEIDMTTTDGNIYTANNVSLGAGQLKFRGDHSWDLPYDWGGTGLSGTLVVQGTPIAITTASRYDLTFNKTSGAYTIITNTLGVTDFDTIAFKASPNPTQNNWTFSSSQENIESIVIVNISGQTIKTAAPKSNEATIDASGLTAGVYFAKVTTGTATQTLKLIKQ